MPAGKPSLTLLRALIAQQPLLSDAKQRQKILMRPASAHLDAPDRANALVINADENILAGWICSGCGLTTATIRRY